MVTCRGCSSGGRRRRWRGTGSTPRCSQRPGLIEDGKLTPVVDPTYPLADTAEGLRNVEQEHARGKAVVTVA
jgi:NADPH:quinone reductase-like Zn-dependent oxidoreductase